MGLQAYKRELAQRVHGNIRRSGDTITVDNKPTEILCVRWSGHFRSDLTVPLGYDYVSYLAIQGKHPGWLPVPPAAVIGMC